MRPGAGHLNEAHALYRDEVVWVPGNLAQISRIWTGSAQELAAEMGQRFFNDQAGLLIHVGGWPTWQRRPEIGCRSSLVMS